MGVTYNDTGSMFLVMILLGSCVNAESDDYPSYKKIYDRQKDNNWFTEGTSRIEEILGVKDINKKAKGVVLFIGDGMGPSTVTAARILDGQLQGNTGEEHILSWEKFPNVALSKTYNVDQTVPDSAGTATAYLTGVKSDAGVISVDERIEYNNCASSKDKEVLSIIMMAEKAGLSTGVVTSTRVTHATPGCSYAHAANREWEGNADDGCKDIAQQAIAFGERFGNGLEVLMGGGRREFMSKDEEDPENANKKGNREDKRDLTREWRDLGTKTNEKFEYVWNKQQLNKLNPDNVDHVLGLFAHSHMEYMILKNETENNEPTLSEMAIFAINVLKRNPNGYVLLVEGGRIDHGHHANRPVRALHEAVELAKAVKKVDEMTDEEEVLLITTADHSHVFTLGGYQKRGTSIFGLTEDLADDGKRFPTLGYTNGPGGLNVNESRQDPLNLILSDPNQRYTSLIPRSSETHGGEDVGIYARGPQAHLVRGTVEENVIFHIMDYALCLSDSKKKLCESKGLLNTGINKDTTIGLILGISLGLIGLMVVMYLIKHKKRSVVNLRPEVNQRMSTNICDEI